MKYSFLRQFLILLLILIRLTLSGQISNDQWNYGKLGPDVWNKYFSSCGGINQSPIDIKTICTTYQQFQPFHFSSIYNKKMNFTLHNDGHTIKATHDGTPLILDDGNLNGNYIFINFHLHWGPNENVGSEHQVNGVKYTGESHFVFKNNHFDEYVVLAFLMKDQSDLISEKDKIPSKEEHARTNEWKRYFDATQKLIKINDSTSIELNLSLLILNNLNDFWRYDGSLTTPPCTENVKWTIFKEPISIYNYEFTSVRDDLYFESYRGLQPLYYRQIYRSFENEISSSIPDETICLNKDDWRSKSFSFSNNLYYISNNGFSFKNNLIYFCLFYNILIVVTTFFQ